MDGRDLLIRTTRKGVGFPIAGAMFWIIAGLLTQFVPVKHAVLYMFFVTGSVFPLGYVISKMMGAEVLGKETSLDQLAAILAAVQLFFWPVIILVYLYQPMWTPFVMAVLFSSHFLPYGWLYKSRGYYYLAISSTAINTILILFCDSWSYFCTPWATALLYAICSFMIIYEDADLIRNPESRFS